MIDLVITNRVIDSHIYKPNKVGIFGYTLHV